MDAKGLPLAFQRAAVGVALMEADGTLREANPALQQMLGSAEPDLLAALHPDDRRAASQLLAETIAGKRAVFELQCRFDGARAHHARLLVSRAEDERALVIVEDLTQAWAALEAMRASEALFRTAFESAASGIAVLDADGRIARANAAFAKLLGREPASLIGLEWRSLVHPEDLPRADQLEREKPGGSYHFEGRLAGSRAAWMDVGVAGVPDARGKPMHTVIQLRDLSGRKAAEDALATALRDRERILDSIQDAFLRLDVDGRVLEWNVAALATTRLAPDTLAGRPAVELVADEDRPSMMNAVLAAFIGGRATLEARIAGADAPILEWTLTRLDDERGATMGLSVFGRDVTARRQAETSLRRESVTKDLVRHMMIGLGTQHAALHLRMRDIGRNLAARAGLVSLDEHLDAFASMGLGELRLASVEKERYTFVGRDLLEVAPRATKATCLLPLGFLEGTVAAMHGAALGTETRCRSMGHPECVFVVQPRGTWRGPERADARTRAR